MKRFLDLTLSSCFLILLSPLFILLACIIKTTSAGLLFFYSKRVGLNNSIFEMPKFRTMIVDTPIVSTRSLKRPSDYITCFGFFIRKFSIDELPHLLCVLKGQMSIVGPRPALFSQKYLVKIRTDAGVHKFLPGLTGLAQINGRDNLTIKKKVALDKKYVNSISFFFRP